MSKAIVLHLLNHIRNIWLCIRFPFPEIKRYIQILIVTFQIGDRYTHNMLPKGTIAFSAIL